MEQIAILTNFMEFHPGYSLTGIVQDQVRMLLSHGHEVHVFVNEHFAGRDEHDVLPPGDFAVHDLDPARLHVHKSLPFIHLKDYGSEAELSGPHREAVARTVEVLRSALQGVKVVFTHDFVFTGWFMPYGLACRELGREDLTRRWLHWVHSVPRTKADWWDIRAYGPHHKLVYPNQTDRLLVAEQYRGTPADVRVIHHIKDVRSWMDFGADTCRFIRRFPAVLEADVVQVYPASNDRLHAKRIEEVIRVLAAMKRLGRSVCLVVANQWATTEAHAETVRRYEELGRVHGVEPGRELVFTSTFDERFRSGIPKRMVRELFQCANLFIFPTREESFGLVLPEAALGGVLTVCNRSLRMLAEVAGNHGLFFDFGSFHQEFRAEDLDAYLDDVARVILGRMRENDAIGLKTHVRQRYNWDHLYREAYAPVIAESVNW